jgi:hypothetical protein
MVATGSAQVMVGLMPASMALTTGARPCRRWGAQRADAVPRPTGDPGAQPACPWPARRSTWPRCPSASHDDDEVQPDVPAGPARPAPALRPGSGSGSCPSRSRTRQGGQTQALLAVWLPAAPTRSTKSPGADTADANVERVATGAGRRTSTPGHWTPDAWTSHGRTLDAHTGHRTPDVWTLTEDADRVTKPRQASGHLRPRTSRRPTGRRTMFLWGQRLRRSAIMTARR